MLLVKVLLLFVLAGIGCGYGPNKMSLTVLYESKCPDSISFILNQLLPAMELLRDRVQLKLVPFGKARSIDHGYRGFQCQHGPSECLGNLVQDCTLDLMSDRSDLEKAAYVACEMATLAGTVGSLECALQANVSEFAVKECVADGRGIQLQLESESTTNYFKPKFIPMIIVNGVFNQQVQDMSTNNLYGTLSLLLNQDNAIYNNFASKYVR